MAYEKIQIIPHRDIELNVERQPIDLFVTTPEEGIKEDTGLIFLVNEFGSFPDAPDCIDSTHPTLANQYNCIVASVSYFGIYRNKQMDISDVFLRNLNRIYNLKFTTDTFADAKDYFDAFRIIAKAIAERGVTSVDLRCQPLMITGRNEYQSWGLLPAIDCLTAVGEILKNYPQIDTKRLYAFGQYYGGYIASLMGKFAPNTFATVINKSGYSRVETRHILCGETLEEDITISFKLEGKNYDFTIAACANNPWTIIDETSPNYFSDAHRAIRSLITEKQFMDSETRYILFSEKEDDGYVRFMEKQVEAMKKTNNVVYEKIDSYRDQSIMKMSAFFRYVYEHYMDEFKRDLPSTDFSLNSVNSFDCSDKKYEFRFDKGYNLQVRII